MKKIIIAGSRTINHQPTVDSIINEAMNEWLASAGTDWRDWCQPQIVSGGAMGVDFCGEVYAKKRGFDVKIFPAEWETYGKGAGYIRNKQMAEYADALIALWDGSSRGTKHMIETMRALNKPVFIREVKD